MRDEDRNQPRKKKPTGDYEFGYCRPPVKSRWAPGQSGNPRGARKKAASRNKQDILNLVREEMTKEIMVTEDGKTVRMSIMQVFAKHLMNDFVKGTGPHRLRLFNRLLELGVLQPGASEHEISPIAIADLVRRLAAEFNSDPDSGTFDSPPAK